MRNWTEERLRRVEEKEDRLTEISIITRLSSPFFIALFSGTGAALVLLSLGCCLACKTHRSEQFQVSGADPNLGRHFSDKEYQETRLSR